MQNFNEKNTREFQEKRKRKAKLETIHYSGSKNPIDKNTSNDTDSIYYQLFEHNINAVLLSCPDGTIHAANPAACKLFGRTEDDIKKIGRNGLVDLTDPRLKDAIKEREQIGKFNGELTFIRKDGTKFQGEITSLVFNDKDGNIRTCMTIQDISEQKKAEQDVSEQRNIYDLILKNVHDGIWVTNEKDRLIYFNSEMEKIAGVKSENVLGLSVTKDFPPETNSQFLHFYRKAKKTLEPHNYEPEVVTPAGRKTIQSGWLTPRVKDGKYEGMICTIQDITERKQAEEELQASELWLHNIYNSLNEGVLVITRDRKLININRAAEVMFGYTESEVFQLSTEVFHVDHEHYVEFGQKIKEAFTSKRIANFEFEARRKNGEIFPTEHTVSLLRDAKGHTLGIVSIVRDITERKKSQEVLRQSEGKFHSIAENAREGIMVGEDGKRVYCNPRWREIVGYSEEEYKVIPFLSRIHPDDLDLVIKTYEKLKTREVFESSLEYRIITKYNETKFLAAKASCIYWENKSAELVVLDDITERKKAEQELFEKENLLKETQKLSKLGGWECDIAQNKATWTDEVYKIYGVEKDFDISDLEKTLSFYHEEDRESLRQAFEKCFSKQIPYDMEVRFINAKGEHLWCRTIGRPVIENGKLIKLRGNLIDITERKKVELQLKESEEKYRLLVETLNEGIWKIDDKGYTTFVNSKMAEMLDYSVDEMLGKHLFSFMDEKRVKIAKEKMNERKNGIKSQHEFIFQKKNGQQIRTLLNTSPIFDSQGNYAGAITGISDITEYTQAMEQIKTSEIRYRELFNHMLSGVAVYDVIDGGKDFIFKDFNHSGELIDKQSRTELIGKSIMEVRPGAIEFGLIDAFHEAIKSGETVHHPVKFYKDNRLSAWYDNYIYLLPSGELVVVFDNVTEKKKAEEALIASEAKYKALFDNSIEGIGLAQGNKVISANKALLNIFGYDSIEEFTGIPLLDHSPLESQDMIRNILKRREKGDLEPAFSYVYKIIRKDGAIRDIEISRASIQLEGEDYTLSTFRDITELKLISESLKEKEEKLRFITENIEDIFWMSTPGIKEMIYISPSYEKIWGQSCQSLYDNPKSFLDIVHPDDREILFDTLKKYHAHGKTYCTEYRIQSSEGKIKWVSERGFPVYDEHGNLRYMTGICTDITSKKQVQDALQDNESLLNEVGRIAKIGGWEMDLIARKAKWTQGTYDIVEIDYDKPIPGPDGHLDYYFPEYKPIVEKAINELIEKDTPLCFEAKAKTAKGNIKWFRAAGKAIRENGVCTKIVGTLQDITEIKHSEEILNNHRRLLEKQMYLSKTLLDALPCVALLLKPETHEIVASNKAAIKVGAIPGKTCYETWAQRANTCPWCMAPKLWKTGKEQHAEVEYMGIFWDAYWIPVSDDLYMHFAFDITERKKIEASIFKYQQKLKSLASQLTLTEEKERYRIAMHLHDHIGQYLAISRMKLVELLNSEISAGTYNTVKLIDEWLHHAIQETRSLTYDLSSPILHELGIEKAITAWLNDEITKKHKIETEFYCDKPHISLDDDIQVVLFRNVRELLFNVVKHAHAGKIKVAIKTKDNNIQIIVEDDGIGFNPAEIAETAPGKAQFGLFSIRERLEHFGGNMKIETAAGQGCRITLTASMKKD